MDQFRQVGKVLGGIQALMVLKFDIAINQKQCCLLLDMFNLAFETISEEIKQNLRLEENETNWKSLENPLKELHKIFKEGEVYIQSCLDIKDWWGKAISLHQNRDCVEYHIHNLLWCFTIIIEAIESSGEISGVDQDDMHKRRLMLIRKYDKEWNDPKIFQWRYAKQYLVSRETCSCLTTAWKEDRTVLLEKVREKRRSTPGIMAKHERRLANFFIKKFEGVDSTKGRLLPARILLRAKNYYVKRRLESLGSHHKEIFWLGESFALRVFFGEINEQIQNEISFVLSLSHPNVVQYFSGFYDDVRKEGYLVFEIMNECLANYVRDNSGQRKKAPFSLLVAVDIMLQVARGMEYLHSKEIYHGDLNSSNVLLKTRNTTSETYIYAKVTGFGLTSINSSKKNSNQKGNDFIIWHAPEVHPQIGATSKFTEKADVYSFGMLCFEILTGKTPFEEGHLQGDKMSRNISAGERPLFPYTSPKFLVNFIKKCWQADPFQRPSFSSICRILRYMKKGLVINPDRGQIDSPPAPVDYCDIEAGYSKMFPSDDSPDLSPVWKIPFQMFAYRLVEKEKTNIGSSEKPWESAIEGGWGELSVDQRSVYSEVQDRRRLSKAGVDQRSVCSESSPTKLMARKRSEFLSRKLSRDVFAKLEIGSEIEEKKPVVDDHISDSSDSIPDNKTFDSLTPDQVSDSLESEEGKLLPKDGIFDDKVYSEMKTLKVEVKQNVGRHMIHGRKITDLVRGKSDSFGAKKQERTSLPLVASDDSDVGSISPEHAEEKKESENLGDLKSDRFNNPYRKFLLKAKSVPAKNRKSQGRQLSPTSSRCTEIALSPAQPRAYSPRPPIPRTRSQKVNGQSKLPPWI